MRNRDTKDRNRKRGVSALRRTGPKYTLPVSKEPLPEPVLDPKKRSKPVGNKKHGLWDFFDKDQKPFGEPETVAHHGKMFLRDGGEQEADKLQGGHGRSKSYAPKALRISIACGGYV